MQRHAIILIYKNITNKQNDRTVYQKILEKQIFRPYQQCRYVYLGVTKQVVKTQVNNSPVIKLNYTMRQHILFAHLLLYSTLSIPAIRQLTSYSKKKLSITHLILQYLVQQQAIFQTLFFLLYLHDMTTSVNLTFKFIYR